MQLHNLSNTPGKTHSRKRIGRGNASGQGSTAGRGHKGQKARSGYSRKALFEGGQMPIVRRMPKRGFHHAPTHRWVPVNVADLNRFENGAEIDLAALRATGLAKGLLDGVKILGTGELKLKLTVRAQSFSAAAKAKIEAAGGRWEVVA